MQYYFEEKENLKLDEVQVLVQSQKKTKEVQEILDYLGAYDQGEVTVLPIKTSVRIEMLKVDDLIYADVEGDSLILETSKGRILTNDRLYKFSQRLNNPD
ncbi:hypothetical protein, partial [Streptococcus sobrinus]